MTMRCILVILAVFTYASACQDSLKLAKGSRKCVAILDKADNSLARGHDVTKPDCRVYIEAEQCFKRLSVGCSWAVLNRMWLFNTYRHLINVVEKSC